MTLVNFIQQLNEWGSERIPFLFLFDFELKRPVAYKINEIDPSTILYSINGFSNYQQRARLWDVQLKKFPVAQETYQKKFEKVFTHLEYGDSFLTNLTVRTPVHINYSLSELFTHCRAKYTCWYKDEFLVFSPETFIQIKEGKIFAYPMKGTIDAEVENAATILLNDEKERAEHVTIVDLIRNDLSQVASQVQVTRFRYLDHIKTNSGSLLQASSEISGILPVDYYCHLGDIMVSLLPAGSICGAPKPKTIEIIQQAEEEERGYYTGVIGYFDGTNLDSGVMIRFIENVDGQYYYRSGGGITTQSKMEAEYQETIHKIYVPVN
jgi:para-aminobenzoate synthetase component 1